MPNPKNFSQQNAAGEQYILDVHHPGQVIVYRFGDRDKSKDWESPMRRSTPFPGNYPRPADSDLNEKALLQSSYGSQAENAAGNPFLSVATAYSELFENGEVWVQNILKSVPDLGVFSIPYALVFRPSPTKLISKQETEWLYYDGDAPMLNYLDEWRDNPYLNT